ncbi:MAG TPA: glycosyltransferase family 9 protein [Ignavibacteriaceae bacterium]|nr:glycosyltransferase family 9 protein [Ignavibacteriaceae bacterium]
MTFYEKIQKRNKLFKAIQAFFSPLFKTIRYFRKSADSKSDKTLIILLHKIGDTIFTIPAVLALRKEVKNQVVILCCQHSEYLYKLFIPNITCVLVSRDDFYFKYRIAKSYIRKKINSLDPSLIFDLTGECNSASIIFNSKANQIAGINKDLFQGIYDSFSRIESETHLVLRYLNFVELFFNKKISLTHSFQRKKKENIENIFIHPFAGWKSKEWGLKKFIDIGLFLSEEFNVNFIIPTEAEYKEYLEILKENNIKYFLSDSIPVLIDLLKQCDLFIGNDSGPLYMANILDCATFTVYSPTNPRYSGPFGKWHSYVYKKIKCSAGYNSQMCFTNGGREGCPSNECSYLLTVDEVKEKLVPFIKELNSSIITTDDTIYA